MKKNIISVILLFVVSNACANYPTQQSQSPYPTQQSQQATRPLGMIMGRMQDLSIQSILGGTLGEPYTEHANEIYNSRIPSFVETFKNDIMRDIKSDSPLMTKVNMLKATIERLYNLYVSERDIMYSISSK
jgi:hypothetical protein